MTPTKEYEAKLRTNLGYLDSLWFWATFCVVVLLLQALSMDYTLNNYDEGLILYGAVRVLHGALPYRDFWTMYGPGQFYAYAWLFKLFGVYAIWGRLFYMFVNVLTLGSVFYLASILTQHRRTAAFATFAVLVVLAGVNDTAYSFPVYPALSLVMLATVWMVFRWHRERRTWLGAAGAAVGLAALFRHDIAFYAAIALLASDGWFHISSAWPSLRRWLQALLFDAAWFSTGILVIALPVTLLLVARVPMHDLSYSLFYAPARIYPKVRALPFPDPVMPLVRLVLRLSSHRHTDGGTGLSYTAAIYTPLAAVIAATICLAPSRQRKGLTCWEQATYLAVLLLAALMFLKGVVRVSTIHIFQSAVPAVLLLFCLAARRKLWGKQGQVALAVAVCLMTVGLVFPLRVLIYRSKATVNMILHPLVPDSFRALCHPPAGLERATCLYVTPDDEHTALYLEQHTAPNQTIFYGAGRHDKLFANKVDLYFISEREAATKWYELPPGVETTAPIQDEMIDQLNANHAIYVIRDTFFDDVNEPNDSRLSSGVFDLDRYIDANYRIEARFGTASILRRTTPFQSPLD